MNALPFLSHAVSIRLNLDGLKAFSEASRVSPSYLREIGNGMAIPGPRAAKRILDAVRKEELALADKIEAELVAHWLHSGEADE